MLRAKPFLFALLALLFSGSAAAHHAMEVHYLVSEDAIVTHEGVVKNFSLMDPHSYLVVTVEEEGETGDWILEGQSRVMLTRAGWRFDLLSAGTLVKFAAFPARSGDTARRIVYLEVGGELYCSDRCEIFDIETPEISSNVESQPAQRLAESF